ncbi:MAG: helix-turn-helix domain-containing protein [Brooklawnia sp.]|jgi:transcriptional regulator with XRE-family HTH domain
MATVGFRIRQLRRLRGLSQVELGGERYSGSYISHIESGRRQPTGELLSYLAERLGLPPTELSADQSDSGDAELAALLSSARRLHSVHDWDAAVRVARQAVQHALHHARELRRWEAEFLLAEMLRGSDRYLEAAELAEKLAGESVVADTPTLRVDAHTLACRAYRAAGRLPDAIEQGHKAIGLGGQVSAALLAAALVGLLSALLVSGRLGEAHDHEEQLGALVDQLSPAEGANACWVLGNACFLRNEVDQGLAWHTRANQLSDPQVDPHAWARLRQASAYFMVTQGTDLAAAQRWYDESAPLIGFMGTSGDMADMRLLQGHLLLRSGEPGRAVELLELLSEDAAAMDDVRLLAEVHEALGQAWETQAEMVAARAAYRKAAESFEAAGAPDRAVTAWHRYVGAEEAGPSDEKVAG